MVKYIVAGHHKTGTKSLSKAMRSLGYRVFDAGEMHLLMMDVWISFYKGKITIEEVANHYDEHNVDVIVDYPCMFFWKQFTKIWPQAKVILTVRDNTEIWWTSAKQFFHNVNQWNYIKYGWFLVFFSPTGWKTRRDMSLPSFNMVHGTIKMFQNYEDLDNQSVELIMKNRYEAHNANVMHNCPPEKLLIYNVKDGWPSLCAFMEIDHMQGPLPHENKSKDAKDTHEFLDATMEQFMTICKREIYIFLPISMALLAIIFTLPLILKRN